MKSTEYFTEATTEKAGKYLKIWERKTRAQVLAHLLAQFCSRSIVDFIFSCQFHMAIS